MSPNPRRVDLAFGLLGLCLGLATLFVWIPADIDTGVIDTWRRVTRIGDSMLPAFATIGVLLSCLGITVKALTSRANPTWPPLHGSVLCVVAAILAVSIGLMMVTGPILAWVILGPDHPYRALRDDLPWKYTGFLTGGTFLVVALQALATRRIHWRMIGLAFLSTFVIAMIYGLPFEDLLLPPNGDF
ncbi:hypothetical protein PAF17_01735 [Paracoccus sp. Z330]|uniref:Tripartite tricarboxylate transporter TctB family protein n=1 Tax=Paracoccus onchidii TaxID=3017813 RepID=A0ABT4ZAQ5_9RHOB|nr:hypothetical protein [Paracoccus onchidii]MDB6176222.1 hypothetical protein [Paracoccus onchidii]